MSAPRTNLEKQKRHHIVPIIGIIVVVLIALGGFLWWFNDETTDPEIPGEVPGPVGEIAEPPATGAAPVDGAPAAEPTEPTQ